MTQREYRESILDFPPQERAEYDAGKFWANGKNNEAIDALIGLDASRAGKESPFLQGIARVREMRHIAEGNERGYWSL